MATRQLPAQIQQIRSPKFNVERPFRGVVSIHMNEEMVHHLRDNLLDLKFNDDDHSVIQQFSQILGVLETPLADESGTWSVSTLECPDFEADSGVNEDEAVYIIMVLNLNNEAREELANWIWHARIADKPIQAFTMALRNPGGHKRSDA
jgi:hypothetical protein